MHAGMSPSLDESASSVVVTHDNAQTNSVIEERSVLDKKTTGGGGFAASGSLKGRLVEENGGEGVLYAHHVISRSSSRAGDDSRKRCRSSE